MEQQFKSAWGNLILSCANPAAWHFQGHLTQVAPGVEALQLHLSHPAPTTYPKFTVKFFTPQQGVVARYQANAVFDKNLVPEWRNATFISELAQGAPVYALIDAAGQSTITVAVSDALRQIRYHVGLCEFNFEISHRIEFFTAPEVPNPEYEVTLYFDHRVQPYETALQQAFAHWAPPDDGANAVPEAGWQPWYSTWYSFHKEYTASAIEAECAVAHKLGIVGVIVDDGWQTADENGVYDFCGDWLVAPNRIPDMASHVRKIHQLGMKYLLWYSVPFIGRKSRNYARFKGKYLGTIAQLGASVLDPRFPEVREFLTNLYLQALQEWQLDGFKLDFIDRFQIPEGQTDPAARENYAGRDLKSIPLATDLLLRGIITALRRVKPDILIEFRQKYIGPAVRQYGNLFRAGDCPGDTVRNRVSVTDLRFSSGRIAIHGDMLGWNSAESVTNAARQILAVLFAVPQISVRLTQLSPSHLAMLKHRLDFYRQHRATLTQGNFKAPHPELNYPVLRSEGATETISAVYLENQLLKLQNLSREHREIVVNATTSDQVLVQLPQPSQAVIYDVCGQEVQRRQLATGVVMLPIPECGEAEFCAVR